VDRGKQNRDAHEPLTESTLVGSSEIQRMMNWYAASQPCWTIFNDSGGIF
jgi:hypothetical protein